MSQKVMPQFEHRYLDELPGFYTELQPTPLAGARLLYHSAPLAEELGLDSSLFWRRSTVATSLVSGPASSVTGGGYCWASRSLKTGACSTGI
jgi:uncharacterized protein YdiU (UPF0061 family)